MSISLSKTLWRSASIALMCGGAWVHPALAATAILPTDAGTVQGLSNADGRQFLGIPFAAPPIGPLRWKAPQAAVAWPGVRPATQTAHACKQDGTLPPAGVPDSSEDCLYLNVYTPPQTNAPSPLPVMVWIHGGAFLTGAGSQYDGSQLALKANAIVVTVNYRLGIFGMLALDALSQEDPAGNPGLQDQQAALRWVQRNIGQFGGDPKRVTIFGQSAGSISVCQQLISPRAAGLFQRAILQSGPCTFGTAERATALATGDAFAAKVGCPSGPGQLACLRGKTTDEVFQAAPTLDFGDFKSLMVLSPSVDGVLIPDLPPKLIKQGKFHRVPVMVGNTQDEATLFIALAYDLRQGGAMTEAQYQAQVLAVAGSPIIASLITADYASKRLGSPGLATSALVTDSVFACGTQSSARGLSNFTPTYAYEFQERSVPQLTPDPYMPWGAYHASELPFLFQTKILTTPASPDPRDVSTPAQLALADTMVQYWARFAATGNPNGGQAVNWPRFNTLLAATQQLQASKVSTNLLGGIYGKHQCLLWDTATALGLGL